MVPNPRPEGVEPASRPPATPAPGPRHDAPCYRSEDLFGTAQRVVIVHQGQEYVLLITRQDKLLLNRR